MRLLIIADALDASTPGAHARWLADIASACAARGHEVLAIELARDEPHEAAELGAHRAICERTDPAGVMVWRPTPETFDETLGEALSEDPDVIHLASPGPFGARSIDVLVEYPLLLDSDDFWPICPNDDLLRRTTLAPCGDHHPHAACGTCAGLTRVRAMAERARLGAEANVVVTHSRFARARLDAGLGRRVEVVDYGVPLDRFGAGGVARSREVAALFESVAPRILFLGPPLVARGMLQLMDLLVALRARIDRVQLVIAGSDTSHPGWHDVLRAEARELGLERHLVLIPAPHPGEIPLVYAACGVAMAPLLTYEPGGLAMLEAMAAAVPVVASPLGAAQDLFEQGNAGLLVSAEDVPAFADALRELLEDDARRQAMGRAGRQRIERSHTLEQSLDRMMAIYERMQGGARRAA